MILLLTAWSLATEGVDQVPTEATVPGWQVGSAEPPLFDIRRTIDQAIEMRRRGEVAGAGTLLDGLGGLVPPDLMGWYLYQRGICHELQWQMVEARARYEQAITLGADHVPDARFRLALVLEDLGDPVGALEQMQLLARLRGLDEADQETVALQTGITEVNAGKTRRGLRRIDRALATLAGTDGHTWLRAKAHYTRARTTLAAADATRLQGSQSHIVHQLKKRVARLNAAEGEITTLVGLQEPEWIVASMIVLGDTWKRLGDDLAHAPPPPRLSEEERVIYAKGIDPYVQNAYTKAWHYWDAGVGVANRLGFESPKVEILKARRKSVPR